MSDAPTKPLRLIPLRDRSETGLPYSPRTIARRRIDDPDFPEVFRIGRDLWVEAEALETYKRKLMERGRQARTNQNFVDAGGARRHKGTKNLI